MATSTVELDEILMETNKLPKTLDQEVLDVANFVKTYLDIDSSQEVTIPFSELEPLINIDEDDPVGSKNRIRHVLAKHLEKKFNIKATRSKDKYIFKNIVASVNIVSVDVSKNKKSRSIEIPFMPNGKYSFVKDAIMMGDFPLLVGPKGCGKSRTAEEVAKDLGLRYIRIALGEIREPADLIGTKEIVIENGSPKTKFVPGLLTQAAIEGWVAILDEFDSVNPSVSLALNKILEGGNSILLPMETGVHEIIPHENFTVICTANTWGNGDSSGHYSGTFIQNRATLDRLRPKIDFDYDVDLERQILKPYLPVAILDAFFNMEGAEVTHGIVVKIRKSPDIDDTIGMRSLIGFARYYQKWGWHIAMHFMLNDIAEDFRPIVKKMVVDQFGKEFIPSDNFNDRRKPDFITEKMKKVVAERGF